MSSHEHTENDGHDHNHENSGYLPAITSFILLLTGLAIEHVFKYEFFDGWVLVTWYIAAYLPVALPVIKETIEALKNGEVFTEFFLMTIATVGAMAIGEYPEGVAVMLFYAIGELFQNAAVNRAKNNITALLDVRPKTAHVLTNGNYQTVDPESVKIGDTIQIKVGEKVPLDGKLISDKASLNAAAITGESKPQSLIEGENVLAGSINLESVIEVEVEKLYNDSSVAKILNLVQNATAKKAKTELLIRRLAKIYTPIVVYLAIAICILPYFFVETYQFQDWLYRALIFLVISCPCALVISIPLGYFGGLGAASKNGILFKGATFMDTLIQVNTLVMDKTGTVTKGTFKVKEINISNDMTEDEFMSYVLSLEKTSTHPIAKAIMQYENSADISDASDVDEIAGKGLRGIVKSKSVLAGNKKLMDQFEIKTPDEIDSIVDSIVLVAIDGDYAGFVTISDELKDDANQTILAIRNLGIKEIVMLSGDKDSITQMVAGELSISQARGGLLPEDKLNHVEKLKEDPTKVIAFMGDGINDAPVLATSHLGIAMGANGSDVAIETADMIIQTDQPSKFVTGFNISKSTQGVIWQNIILAFGVKVLVLILGAAGMATLWQAVFADVGVALLAILNAVRLQKMKW
ncbi:heavy metal translocating P-type ATPase [Marinicella sp. S1101]|uniref:heavy metal translocating P-type ATPase n=1 Tax=Marinicella marina TaxID=2996016 RepID=UPI0022608E9A|nr:heavy metal translocating P-type ATPase [Marinicella marina]MCX7554207.1 heavy metal translocating P-type ATPase [Marinicella marina]MDJ1141100.1 heavy metal translocating P-type ATPase [Marinicella marina]